MTHRRARSLFLSLASGAVLCAALAGPARASVATPPSGTPIEVTDGDSFKIKLSNAQGCSFDFLVVVDPAFLDVSPADGTDVKGATIVFTALKAGTTNVTVSSLNQTCPPADHDYQVTIVPDIVAMLKEFDEVTKGAEKQVKIETKLALVSYSSQLKDLGVDFKGGLLDDDTLQDGFHAAAGALRRSIHDSATMAYTDVLGTGTQLLVDNDVALCQGPVGFFAGGGGSFDRFQDSVCGNFADFHDRFEKLSWNGIKAFEKAGAPRYGQWNVLPPVFAGGPFYASQLSSLAQPEPLLGPLTFTVRPTTSPARDNGRLLVSGTADTALSGQLEIALSRVDEGEPPTTFTATPTITDDEWTVGFSGLLGGSWSLAAKYTGDQHEVVVPLHVPSQP